jgi:hypothetical protein
MSNRTERITDVVKFAARCATDLVIEHKKIEIELWKSSGATNPKPTADIDLALFQEVLMEVTGAIIAAVKAECPPVQSGSTAQTTPTSTSQSSASQAQENATK